MVVITKKRPGRLKNKCTKVQRGGSMQKVLTSSAPPKSSAPPIAEKQKKSYGEYVKKGLAWGATIIPSTVGAILNSSMHTADLKRKKGKVNSALKKLGPQSGLDNVNRERFNALTAEGEKLDAAIIQHKALPLKKKIKARIVSNRRLLEEGNVGKWSYGAAGAISRGTVAVLPAIFGVPTFGKLSLTHKFDKFITKKFNISKLARNAQNIGQRFANKTKSVLRGVRTSSKDAYRRIANDFGLRTANSKLDALKYDLKKVHEMKNRKAIAEHQLYEDETQLKRLSSLIQKSNNETTLFNDLKYRIKLNKQKIQNVVLELRDVNDIVIKNYDDNLKKIKESYETKLKKSTISYNDGNPTAADLIKRVKEKPRTRGNLPDIKENHQSFVTAVKLEALANFYKAKNGSGNESGTESENEKQALPSAEKITDLVNTLIVLHDNEKDPELKAQFKQELVHMQSINKYNNTVYDIDKFQSIVKTTSEDIAKTVHDAQNRGLFLGPRKLGLTSISKPTYLEGLLPETAKATPYPGEIKTNETPEKIKEHMDKLFSTLQIAQDPKTVTNPIKAKKRLRLAIRARENPALLKKIVDEHSKHEYKGKTIEEVYDKIILRFDLESAVNKSIEELEAAKSNLFMLGNLHLQEDNPLVIEASSRYHQAHQKYYALNPTKITPRSSLGSHKSVESDYSWDSSIYSTGGTEGSGSHNTHSSSSFDPSENEYEVPVSLSLQEKLRQYRKEEEQHLQLQKIRAQEWQRAHQYANNQVRQLIALQGQSGQSGQQPRLPEQPGQRQGQSAQSAQGQQPEQNKVIKTQAEATRQIRIIGERIQNLNLQKAQIRNKYPDIRQATAENLRKDIKLDKQLLVLQSESAHLKDLMSYVPTSK
uniref:Uncharacterized protein n=1 Tax=viral metagenome TaxID=1070528 RepID=A0A6C0HMA2_9ZZZZ